MPSPKSRLFIYDAGREFTSISRTFEHLLFVFKSFFFNLKDTRRRSEIVQIISGVQAS